MSKLTEAEQMRQLGNLLKETEVAPVSSQTVFLVYVDNNVRRKAYKTLEGAKASVEERLGPQSWEDNEGDYWAFIKKPVRTKICIREIPLFD